MLTHFWSLLQDENNRAVLAWIGSGVMVVAGGVWAVLKFVISKPSAKSAATPVNMMADRGGFIAARDIRGNTINQGGGEKR